MIAFDVILKEPAWPDLADKKDKIIHLGNESKLSISGLFGGMESGAPSVAIRFDLPDGTPVVAETSLKLFLTVSDMLKAKYGDPR